MLLVTGRQSLPCSPSSPRVTVVREKHALSPATAFHWAPSSMWWQSTGGPLLTLLPGSDSRSEDPAQSLPLEAAVTLQSLLPARSVLVMCQLLGDGGYCLPWASLPIPSFPVTAPGRYLMFSMEGQVPVHRHVSPHGLHWPLNHFCDKYLTRSGSEAMISFNLQLKKGYSPSWQGWEGRVTLCTQSRTERGGMLILSCFHPISFLSRDSTPCMLLCT